MRYSTYFVSILVNGSQTNSFVMERGVQQGDPLSPFFFLITVEGLECIIDKAMDVGLLEGIHIGSSNIVLSLLQFADDPLIFLPADLDIYSYYWECMLIEGQEFEKSFEVL